MAFFYKSLINYSHASQFTCSWDSLSIIAIRYQNAFILNLRNDFCSHLSCQAYKLLFLSLRANIYDHLLIKEMLDFYSLWQSLLFIYSKLNLSPSLSLQPFAVNKRKEILAATKIYSIVFFYVLRVNYQSVFLQLHQASHTLSNFAFLCLFPTQFNYPL